MIKNVFGFFAIAMAFMANAQDYSFSKTSGAYTDLTGANVLANNDWKEFGFGIKVPFAFKIWNETVTDSVYLDDYGTLSLDTNYNGEISFLGEDCNSRGAGKSVISYLTSGSSPNRIFKLEFKNVGFDLDKPLFKDSANVQFWIYETSNIVEYRYGSNKVKTTSWSDDGAFVSLTNSDFSKFIVLQMDPASPTVNKTNIFASSSLTGMPANGTIYKFTPATNSVSDMNPKMVVIQNKLKIAASIDVKAIQLYNSSGQLLQQVTSAEALNLDLNKSGIYFIKVETSAGIISQKILLNN
jgi:hypothetical protein